MNKESIVREAASQRRHYRLCVPLRVALDGKEYVTRDWSIGGICIHEYAETAAKFDELDALVSVAFGDFKIHFETQLRVTRYDADKQEIAAEFYNLNEKQQALLKYFSDSLIRGEMVPIDDTIKRIDIPVTPVSDKPDVVPNKAVPLRRRSLKTLAMSGTYLIFGIVIAYYALNTVYMNVFKLRIDTAAITGPDRVMKAPVSGVIDQVYIEIGDYVTPNDPLFYIRNENVLEEIELAKIDFRNAQIDLRNKEQELRSQRKKLESYREFGVNKLQIAKAKTVELREKLRLAEKRQKRLAKLHADGSASEESLDRAAEKVIGLSADLEVAIARQHIADRAIKETYKGRYYTDDLLVGEVDELTSAAAAARERAALEEERLKVLESRLERLVVNAAVDGKVLSLYQNVHQIVEKGEPLLLIEHHDGERGVEAFISAEEMDNVSLDQTAKVIINGKTHALNARVTSIERTGVQGAGVTRTIGPDDDVLGLVRVKLSFANHHEYDIIAALPSGLPVTVEFSKGNFAEYSSLIAGIGDFIMPIGTAKEAVVGN